jgi:hypothetical protein
MVQISATTCDCITILWVSLVSFAAVTLCVASERVFIVVSVYFVIDSVRELLDTRIQPHETLLWSKTGEVSRSISYDAWRWNWSLEWCIMHSVVQSCAILWNSAHLHCPICVGRSTVCLASTVRVNPQENLLCLRETGFYFHFASSKCHIRVSLQLCAAYRSFKCNAELPYSLAKTSSLRLHVGLVHFVIQSSSSSSSSSSSMNITICSTLNRDLLLNEATLKCYSSEFLRSNETAATFILAERHAMTAYWGIDV